MNRVITETLMLVLVISLSTLTVGGQPTSVAPTSAAATTNTAKPMIQFDLQSYDFGRVQSGVPVKHTFVFTNTGDALLIITGVNAGCGCTTVGEWTKQVEPGNTGSIPIQFNTGGYSTAVTKHPTVTCNAANQPTAFLELKGTVYLPYQVIPQMAVFTLPPDSESATLTVTITNNMEKPLLLSPPEINNKAFSAQLITNVLGKGYQVKISTVPPLPAAPNTVGQMLLKTSWTNAPTIPVTLVANIQQTVVVAPNVVNLGPGPLARTITNTVLIQNNSATNLLKLSDAAVNVPGVDVQIRENVPGKSFTALLAFQQGFLIPPGRMVEFSFKTSNPRYPLVKVPVHQLPWPPPQLPPPVIPTVAPIPAPAPAPTAFQPAAVPAVVQPPPDKNVSAAGDPPRPPPPPLPPGL